MGFLFFNSLFQTSIHWQTWWPCLQRRQQSKYWPCSKLDNVLLKVFTWGAFGILISCSGFYVLRSLVWLMARLPGPYTWSPAFLPEFHATATTMSSLVLGRHMLLCCFAVVILRHFLTAACVDNLVFKGMLYCDQGVYMSKIDFSDAFIIGTLHLFLCSCWFQMWPHLD